MKKTINFTIIIGILILIISTCKKNMDSIAPKENVFLSYVEIGDLENWLPEEYFSDNSRVVYVNEGGQEKKLNIYMVRGNQERVLGDQNYSSETFTVRMRDENDVAFTLDIEGYAVYGDENDLQKTIFVLLMPGNENGSTSLPIQFDENGSKITPFNIFEEEVTMFGYTYKEVYKGGAFSDILLYESFSEVAINSEVGIVYFRDMVNDIWVFDRYE